MNRIKELRQKRKLSQQELALKVGSSNQAISAYENETRKPKEKMWRSLADFFGVSVFYLKGMDLGLTEQQKHCPHCHYPFKPIMENHLVTEHVKDYCKVYLGVLGDAKIDGSLSLICKTCVDGRPTIQIANVTACPKCGRELNNEAN